MWPQPFRSHEIFGFFELGATENIVIDRGCLVRYAQQ